jgi:general secretion pathway protein A
MTLLSTHSRKIPRIINVMCDNALLIGFAKASKKIDEAIMLEVIRDMNGALSDGTSLSAPEPLPVPEPAVPPARKLSSLQRLLASVAARRRT